MFNCCHNYDTMSLLNECITRHPEIKANTYPISGDSEAIVNSIKRCFFEEGSSYLDHIDTETIRELNKLSHPNILLYNIVRNDYILKRFVTVLRHNFGYNHGENFEDNITRPENIAVLEFVKDIFNVANITFVDESTKQTYLRIKFVKRGLKPQVVDHTTRANFEFDILKRVLLEDKRIDLFSWLSSKTILDIGCGPGHFLGELEHNGISERTHLHGIDVASYIKPKYQDKFNFHTYVDNTRFPRTLPKFDFISFFMSIHHIELYKLHLILLQLYEMLNDDGYIYVKEHLVECQDDVTFFKFMETYFYFVEGYIPNVPVEDNYYTREGMVAVFELYGFQMVTNFEINKNQPFKPFYYLFKKNPRYSKFDVSVETKMSILTTIVATMRASNVFSNGNLFRHAELNDFSPENLFGALLTENMRISCTETIGYQSILDTERERTELQIVRSKSERLNT